MSIVWATNFGEYTASLDFFDNSSTTGHAMSVTQYSSVFGYSNGGGSTFRMTNNSPVVTKNVTAATEFYSALKFCKENGSGSQVIIRFDEGGTNHLNLQSDSAGTISARLNTTTLATGATIFTPRIGMVLTIQVHVLVADSGGVCDARISGGGFGSNSSNEITFSGDTRNGATGVINRVGASMSSGEIQSYTDWVLYSTGGSEFNSWPGPIRVVNSYTATAGSSGVQFTPLSSTNASNIDDPVGLHDADTTYNSDTVAGHIDWFTYPSSDFTGMSGTIKCAIFKYVHRTPDAGTHTIRGKCKKGGTTNNGTTVTVPASYSQPSQDVFSTDPSTGSAWASFGAVTGAEYGYEMVS